MTEKNINPINSSIPRYQPSNTSSPTLSPLEQEILEHQNKLASQQALEENGQASWLLQRVKKDSFRYSMAGKKPENKKIKDLNSKGAIQDRITVLDDLIQLVTSSDNLAEYLQANQDIFAKSEGKNKFSPYLKELYCAALDLDGVSDKDLEEILSGKKKFKGKSYSLKNIAEDQNFLFAAHKALVTRQQTLSDQIKNFNYASLGFVGKFAGFNWLGHQTLIGYPLSLASGHCLRNLEKIEAPLVNSDFVNECKQTRALLSKAPKHWWQKLALWSERTGFQSNLIGRHGYEKAQEIWGNGVKQALLSYKDGKYIVNGKTFKTLADATKAIIKGSKEFKGAHFSIKALGFARGMGKNAVLALLGRGPGVWGAVGIGLLISGYFWAQEHGGLIESSKKIASTVNSYGKNILGPLDLVPNYSSWWSA